MAPPDRVLGSRAVGFTDVAFLGGGPHLLAAAGRGGQVRPFFSDRCPGLCAGCSALRPCTRYNSLEWPQVVFWDKRMRKLPCTHVAAARVSGQLTCVQAAPDGCVVYAGSEAGEVSLTELLGVPNPVSGFPRALTPRPAGPTGASAAARTQPAPCCVGKKAALSEVASWTVLTCIWAVHVAARLQLAERHQAQVLAWDVRCGAGVLGTHRHPQLAAVGLLAALARVPGLTAETAVPAAMVASLALDPHDSSRIAFHLSSGWSGARLGIALSAMQPQTRAQPVACMAPGACMPTCCAERQPNDGVWFLY